MTKKNGSTPETVIMPTSGAAWRKPIDEGVSITLPSGNVAKLRPVDFSIVIRSGHLPDSLTPIVIEMFKGESKPVDSLEAFGQFVGIVEAVCLCAFVEPKIVEKPKKDNEISLDHLTDMDKSFVFGLMGWSGRELESFRQEQNMALESVHADEDDGRTAESAPEPEGMGESELSD